jgi:hypothetical protein
MRSLSIAVLWLAPSLALAQTQTPTDLFGPANPQLQGPPAAYRSVFDAPPPQGDEASWRRANDEAGRLRGHTGQLRESDEPPATPQPAGAAPMPPSGMHNHGTN